VHRGAAFCRPLRKGSTPRCTRGARRVPFLPHSGAAMNRDTNDASVPFFARFLETQDYPQVKSDVKAGIHFGSVTLKFPSDSDEGQTMKAPSDNDEVGFTL
jgi:hypothetical protein